MKNEVRVRFAPSPTGPLHIGGVRTALFNYLYAKKNNGTFILRIEDTDQKRYVDKAEEYIKESLNWCNIPYDEGPGKEKNCGPYRQSERKEIYKEHIIKLINSNKAYYGFDTPAELDALRKESESKGETFVYSSKNRGELNNSLTISKEELDERLKNNTPYVIRFKIKEGETLNLIDEIRGDMKIDTSILDDKILFKSDGMPTYHLANVVDDHLMNISHVIRGEEWLPSLALHVLLYKAFDWKSPSFAHLPLILKPKGKGKLSKRDGDTGGFPVFPLEWKDDQKNEIASGYKEEGYLPEAVVNMLAFLGWNPGTEQEIFSHDELINAFDLKKVNKAGAKFDPEKSKWFQQQHLQNLKVDDLLSKYNDLFTEENLNKKIDTKEVISCVKERAVFVKDLKELTSFFYETPNEYDPKAIKKAWKEDTALLMNELLGVIENVDYQEEVISKTVKDWITSKEIGFGKIMMPLRIALVGSLQGPDVFKIASIIGKEETIHRVKKLIEEN